MNQDNMQNLIADFYRVCVFGNKNPEIKDVAKRAYRDLCRTIRDTKQDIRDKAKNEVFDFITSEIEKLENKEYSDYDKFHETLCDGIIDIYKNHKIKFYYGQAQKWVNMLMKYLCVLGVERFPWLKGMHHYLHIPIDSIILDLAINELKINTVTVKSRNISLKNITWSRIEDKEIYDAIQTELRRAIEARNEIPIIWEFNAWNSLNRINN